ncbi:hypothetical protein SEA_INDIGENOUS_73 [Streptomyces phage Indigenous]|uniref:Uncharacterized protein n=4 Tax=Rimavirus rima TaxID=2560784 RepID=A0A7T3KBN1_9CAUD|nr:hypothetical protein SEA_MEIBYSRARUS_69 [Streptomyces phage Meibysrarus]QEQ94289.1 hypothetical protein SEA_HOSHI_72 [Streptomyces phage Hoshi]QGJ96772.1 hypothetical protein SEA_FIDGETORCA_73 [Streptomyces phage FidgetOrca]QPX62100.1 hypothetical protein SEA_INDIGENOUS_73 [Streptomyces phage Indigenous]UOW93219.1 membrane protein [Streptomyces phage TonyStarch]
MNILTFIVLVWLAVVAVAWCIDNGTDILAQRQAEKKRKEAEKKRKEAEKKVHEARLTYAIAKINHARLALRQNPTGTHRLNKVA